MASWISHLMIADRVLMEFPDLCRHEFCIGNIAPDCNVENENWTSFTPPREVTHWMSKERKNSSDCERFIKEYVEKKDVSSKEEESFLLGYYSHLIVDAELQRFIRDENRVKACWQRINSNSELKMKFEGLPETWDTVRRMIKKREWMQDIYSLEKEYLDQYPNSGYLTEVLGLKSFPDYLDYLPENAIVRKIKVMGYLPSGQQSDYPFVCISKEEYLSFIDHAAELVIKKIADKLRIEYEKS